MEITKEPSPILHKKLTQVAEITPAIKELIEAMKTTMIKAPGIGLAANQVGQDLAIFVIENELAEENSVPDTYINPEITEYSKDTTEMEEGCLSLPQQWLHIDRPKKIKIKALDGEGNKIKIKARGLLARVLQHEYDHLQGILIKDHIDK